MRPLIVILACAVALGSPAVAAAQNRAESQLLLELRTVQEQMQKMQLAMNQLSERIKSTETRLDTQASDIRKGFADQKVFIDAIAVGLRTLNERENEGSVRVAQLSQEMKSIRDGLTQQQASLNEIINLLQPLSAAAFASAATAAPPTTDPASAAAPPTGPPSALGTNKIPPSPTAYYNTAMGYYFAAQYDLAVTALGEAIKKFPDYPDAAKAQLTIGDSYYQMGKHFDEALIAYTTVITNYKDPDAVSEAYYKQGLTYEQLGQKDSAIKSFQEVIRLYKDSPVAIMATTALRRLKVIK